MTKILIQPIYQNTSATEATLLSKKTLTIS